MYHAGLGTNKDMMKAREYLNKASQQDCADAQLDLGKMYLSGEGGDKNSEEAKSLIQNAYLNGSKDAKVIMDQNHWKELPTFEIKQLPQ
jgi:hypothetical protein